MPRRDIEKLHEQVEELFADLWQVPRFLGQRGGFRPAVDSYRTDEPRELTVLVELPAVDPGTVEVVVGEGLLLVSGERTRPKVDGRVYQQMEIEYGPFRRQVRLSEDVDSERAHAEYDRGILRITLPIAAAAPPAGPTSIPVERR